MEEALSKFLKGKAQRRKEKEPQRRDTVRPATPGSEHADAESGQPKRRQNAQKDGELGQIAAGGPGNLLGAVLMAVASEQDRPERVGRHRSGGDQGHGQHPRKASADHSRSYA